MPCRDWGDEYNTRTVEVRSEADKKKIDTLTRMLCGLCANTQIYDIRQIIGLEKWWKEHQEQDRQRQAAEKRAKALKKEQDLELLDNLARKLGKKVV